MRIVIAGGHGKVALLLERLLAERGDQAVGLIRNPAHIADVNQAGAEAVVRDLEAASAGDVAVLRSPAPTSPRSLLPRSTNPVPGTRPLSWSAGTAPSPRPCTAFPSHWHFLVTAQQGLTMLGPGEMPLA